jgi:3-oxoacyl-[acyl-carrier protein] reductase
MIDLKTKVAFITGANRGIGKAIALKLAKSGCHISFLNRDEGSAIKTKEELEKLGVEVIFTCGNICDEEVVSQALQKTIEKFSKIDFLINNAGVTQDNLLLRMTSEQWDQVHNTNLKGYFLITKVAAKYMVKARAGKIINIGSVVGHTGNPGQVNYSASKSALVGFTKSIAKELAPRNITCNLISPGFIATDMTDLLSEEQKKEIFKNIPLKRMGTTEDIAGGVLFLCSSMSNYITGSTLHINGGIF